MDEDEEMTTERTEENQRAVGLLTKELRDAETGRVQSVAVVLVDNAGVARYASSLLDGLEVTKHRIITDKALSE